MMERVSGFVDRTSGLIVAVAGLVVALIAYWVTVDKLSDSGAMTALVSLVGTVGTIVGAFFGIKVGAASGEKAMETAAKTEKQAMETAAKAEQHREKAQARLNLLLGHTPSDQFDTISRDYPDLFERRR
jgi:uncharacterized protein YacL